MKDLQIRDGLHVFGRAPDADRRQEFLAALAQSNSVIPAETLAARFDSAAACERDALLAALDGKFVPPGPSGAPTRGRADVLPTGRNLYAIDPRAVPTRSAARACREGRRKSCSAAICRITATGRARW